MKMFGGEDLHFGGEASPPPPPVDRTLLVHVQMHVLTQQYASICTYRVHMHEETKDDDSPKTDTATADLEYYRRVTLPTVTSTSTSRNTLAENIKERITHLLSKCNNCYDINVLENSTQSTTFKQYNTAKILFHTKKLNYHTIYWEIHQKINCNDSLHVADNTNRNMCNML